MRAFGCDIGCGFASVALLTDEGPDPVVLLPKTLPGGMPTTAFARREGQIQVWNNRNELRRSPSQAIHAVKSRLPEETITLYDKEGPFPVSADSAYTAVARDLFALAEREMEGKRPPLREVVLTYPASFADETVGKGKRSLLARMEDCLSRVKVGGQPLRVVGMLPEPAAVALDYLYFMQHEAEESRRLRADHFTVLVYDLGHGTFDTALVTARSVGSPYQMLEKRGLPDVGGQNFDEALRDEILRQLKETYGWTPAGAQQTEEVRAAAVEAKHALSDSERYDGCLFPEGENLEFSVTRARFEELGSMLLARTLECVQGMLRWAAEEKREIDCIVLSGGGSRMPMVRRGLEELTGGKYPVVLHRPEMAVTFGAARYAAGLSGQAEGESKPAKEKPLVQLKKKTANTVLEQLTSRGYGIWVPSKELEGEIRILIPSGTRLPHTSQPLSLRTGSGDGVILRVACTREGKKGEETLPVAACRELIRLGFPLPPETEFQCLLHMDEKAEITLTCVLPDGTEQSRSTDRDTGC